MLTTINADKMGPKSGTGIFAPEMVKSPAIKGQEQGCPTGKAGHNVSSKFRIIEQISYSLKLILKRVIFKRAIHVHKGGGPGGSGWTHPPTPIPQNRDPLPNCFWEIVH
jgi:hypothetical protein